MAVGSVKERRLVTLSGLNVSITGKLPEERKIVSKRLRLEGRATYMRHVSPKTDVLIQGIPSGREKWKDVSTKLREVQELRRNGYGILIINFDEMNKLLAGDALTRSESRAARESYSSPAGVAYRPTKRSITRSKSPRQLVMDLDQLERKTAAHHQLVDAVAEAIEEAGRHPLSPLTSECAFDVAWEKSSVLNVVEVKTIDRHEVQQMRLGLGQVLEYRQTMRSQGRKVKAHLVLSHEPTSMRMIAACEAVGVNLAWPEKYELLFQ